MPISHETTIDKIVDYIPDLFEKLEKTMGSKKKKENIEEIIKNKKPNTKKEEQYEIDYIDDEDLDD